MPLSVPSVACASVIDAPRADLSGSLCPRENNVFLVPRILQFVTLFHSIFFCLDSSVDCGILFAVQHITEFPNHPVEHSFAFCLKFCQHLLSVHSFPLPPSPLFYHSHKSPKFVDSRRRGVGANRERVVVYLLISARPT